MRFRFSSAPNNNTFRRASFAGASRSGVRTRPSKTHPCRESASIYRFQPLRLDQAPVPKRRRDKRWSSEEGRSLQRLAKTMTPARSQPSWVAPSHRSNGTRNVTRSPTEVRR